MLDESKNFIKQKPLIYEECNTYKYYTNIEPTFNI